MQCGFIGLGMLGARMARQVMDAGHALKVFDLDDAAVEQLRKLHHRHFPGTDQPAQAGRRGEAEVRIHGCSPIRRLTVPREVATIALIIAAATAALNSR